VMEPCAVAWLRKDRSGSTSFWIRLGLPVLALLALWACIADIPEEIVKRNRGKGASTAAVPTAVAAPSPQTLMTPYGTGCRKIGSANEPANSITLWLPSGIADAQRMIEAGVVKRLDIRMAMNAPGPSVADALKKRYEEIAGLLKIDGPDLSERLGTLLSSLPQSLSVGDNFVVTYTPGAGTTIASADKIGPVVKGTDLMRVIFTSLLGEKEHLLSKDTGHASLIDVKQSFVRHECNACEKAPVAWCLPPGASTK
jgi:hypothetical protein